MALPSRSRAAEPASPVEPGPLPVAAAIVPGVLVHGSGHFVAGDADTGWKLLGMQGIGLGMVAAAGIPFALTGGSRRTAGPLIAVATHGIGLLFTPMVLDVYGVATGGRDATPAPQDVLVARLGYRYIYDPQFNYRNFAALGLDVGLDALAVHADAWLALDDDNHRIRQQLDWRLLGDAHDVQDGSRLDAQFALTWHDYGTDGFSVLTGEVALDARYATGRIGPSLRGAYLLGAVGYGLETYDYDVPGLSLGEDTEDMLLLRFGVGFFLGHGDGEIEVYYDHRHDDFVGGLGTKNIGGGIPGYFGGSAWHALTETWAVDLDLRGGSALVGGLGVRCRYDGGQ